MRQFVAMNTSPLFSRPSPGLAISCTAGVKRALSSQTYKERQNKETRELESNGAAERKSDYGG